MRKSVKYILILQMLWCIVSAGIFFINTFFFVQNTAFAYGFDCELQKLKAEGVKEIPIDRKICSYTLEEFASHSKYVSRQGTDASLYVFLMSLGMFALTGIALFLQAVGKKKADEKPASSNLQ